MGQGDGENTPADNDYPAMDFRAASFPSDTLSVNNLRRLFPDRLDRPGVLRDGYVDYDFFYPSPHPSNPEPMVRLATLLDDERIVASGAFYRQYSSRDPSILDAEELEVMADAERQLAEGYQYFKLADGPETARLLIERVRTEGGEQARLRQSRGK